MWYAATTERVPEDVRVVEIDGWSPVIVWPVGGFKTKRIEMREVYWTPDIRIWMGYDREVNTLLVGWRELSREREYIDARS